MDTLLLVDDEVSILNSIRRLFMEDETIQVLTASSAKEAVAILSAQAVDVIISDERMPQVSGTEFLRYAHDHFPDAQRIILTGYSSQEATINAINKAEVFRFLTKPWDPADLLATVKHALEIKHLRDSNSELNQKVKIQNEALEKANIELERKVAQRTDQLHQALETLKKQNATLSSQRTGFVQLLIALLGQYDREKGRTARSIWESIRQYADASAWKASDDLPYAAMLIAFVDPASAGDDATFLGLLASIEGCSGISALIQLCHENYNGSGPAAKKAGAIPPEARLLRIALDYHCLNPSNRMLSRRFILNHLDSLYDPDLAKAFLLGCHDGIEEAASYQVEMDNLLDGMTVCHDVQLVNGSILLPSGTVLNASIIGQLKKLSKLINGKVSVFSDSGGPRP